MSLTIVKPSTFKTGEICPQSGVWSNTESSEKIPLSRGQRFPPHNSKLTRWELFKAVYLPRKKSVSQ